MTILGYTINALACPALALVHEDGWLAACFLLVLERVGKAIEKPAKNTIMSFAASQEGAGKSFAIQEALDQIGAVLGPLLLFVVMALKQGSAYERYTAGFAVLIVPAVLTLAALFAAKGKFPHPERFEAAPAEGDVPFRFHPSFRTYLMAISCFAFGFIDFSLIIMHAARTQLLPTGQLPLLYAGAMLVDALAALFFGWLYDKRGIGALILSTLISSLFAPFVFGLPVLPALFLGVALWGIGMGAQESIMKAVVATIVPVYCRASGYGMFEFAFGIFWFLGSWCMGVLYDLSLPLLIAVSVVAVSLTITLYYHCRRQYRREME